MKYSDCTIRSDWLMAYRDDHVATYTRSPVIHIDTTLLGIWGSSVSIVTKLRDGDLDSIPGRASKGIFPLTTASKPALGPTQPIKWVPRALLLGVKQQGREAHHSPPSSAECLEL
jgi:hypothetical protein